MSAVSLRRAAWAGLQDSAPRAALLSIHARVRGTTSSSWEHASLVQLWGPRFSDYVVAAKDLAVFSLGRLPAHARRAARAHDTASRLHACLAGRRLPFGLAGREMGVPANSLRYAAQTGTVLLRWDGARQPVVWTVPAPAMDPWQARLELARRYLHVFGPATPAAFARWAGIARSEAATAFKGLAAELMPVRAPVEHGWILVEDEPAFRATAGPVAPARLLPSGDSYFLLWETCPRAARARRETPGPAVDDARLAGRAARERRGRRCVAPVGRAGLDRPVATAHRGGVGGRRGRGDVAAAARADCGRTNRERRAVTGVDAAPGIPL